MFLLSLNEPCLRRETFIGLPTCTVEEGEVRDIHLVAVCKPHRKSYTLDRVMLDKFQWGAQMCGPMGTY